MEPVGGEFGDACNWQGIEPDQGANYAYLEWQCVVVEAASELFVVFVAMEELGSEGLAL